MLLPDEKFRESTHLYIQHMCVCVGGFVYRDSHKRHLSVCADFLIRLLHNGMRITLFLLSPLPPSAAFAEEFASVDLDS